jgi:cbb3-type cytochrome oxidase subunit 3
MNNMIIVLISTFVGCLLGNIVYAFWQNRRQK